jgi:hypothetical protein
MLTRNANNSKDLDVTHRLIQIKMRRNGDLANRRDGQNVDRTGQYGPDRFVDERNIARWTESASVDQA